MLDVFAVLKKPTNSLWLLYLLPCAPGNEVLKNPKPCWAVSSNSQSLCYQPSRSKSLSKRLVALYAVATTTMMFKPQHSSRFNMHLPAGYIPVKTDILCGRGKTNAFHEGNKIFMKLVRANLDTYQQTTSRIEKSVLVNSLVTSISDSGMRFLKLDKDSNQYIELTAEKAHEKTGHAIRDIIKHRRKIANKKKAAEAATAGTTAAVSQHRRRNSSDGSAASVATSSMATSMDESTSLEDFTPPPSVAPSSACISDPCTSSSINLKAIQRRPLSPSPAPITSASLPRYKRDGSESSKGSRTPSPQDIRMPEGAFSMSDFKEDLSSSRATTRATNYVPTKTTTGLVGSSMSGDNVLLEDFIGDGELGKILHTIQGRDAASAPSPAVTASTATASSVSMLEVAKRSNDSGDMQTTGEVLAVENWDHFVEDAMSEDVMKVFAESPLPMNSKPRFECPDDIDKLSDVLSGLDRL